ncbi:MAG: hypothetical protein AAB513_00905 [Patescibacteria group bacterium]
MKRNEFLFLFGTVSFLIILLWYFGLYLSLFWILWWYDLTMHFLGGFWVALITYILFLYGGEESLSSSKSLFLSIIVTVFLVGIMWEWFELKKGLVSTLANDYLADTVTDIIADMVGAFASYFLITKQVKRKQQ